MKRQFKVCVFEESAVLPLPGSMPAFCLGTYSTWMLGRTAALDWLVKLRKKKQASNLSIALLTGPKVVPSYFKLTNEGKIQHLERHEVKSYDQIHTSITIRGEDEA